MSPEAERSTAELASAGSLPELAVLEQARSVSPSENTVDLEEILEAAGIGPGETTADVDDLSGWSAGPDADPAVGRAADPAEGPDAEGPDAEGSDADPDGLHIDPSEDTVDIDDALAAEGTSVAELTAAGLDAWPGASVTNADEGRATPADGPSGSADPVPAFPPPAAPFVASAAQASDSVSIDSPELPPRSTAPGGAPPRPRRRAVLPFALAAVLLLLAVAGVYAVFTPRLSNTAAAAPAPVAPLTMPPLPAPAADGAAERPAVDPGLAFTDLGLRTLAQPYLLGQSPVCAPSALAAGEQERVVCDLGNGWVGLFVRMVDIDALYALRQSFEQGTGALADTTSSARWDFVAGASGVKDGLEISDPNQGQGVRVRFTDERGTPRLYFDQDATLALCFLASVDPTQNGDALRDYWADPPG